MKLDIQLFADGKVVVDTELNTKNFENGLDKMKSTSQKAGSTIKNIVVGLGIAKAVGLAMNQISNSIDGAVKRVDTLNNFPKVMSNLGIGAKDAEKSIKKMSDKLSGLPTTLDQGAMAVQRFTSANGNVKKSTDIFLALNNAILAGGASTEIQASALEQLSQAYAKGKPDMMEWRTAMTAMPAQLKQVAIAMGYVNTDQLGEALRNGEVSMDDFMEKITELNEKGTDGFQSFEKQARNATGGIGTAVTVAKTQIVKGVADIIKALDIKFEELGIGKVNEIIANLGINAKAGLDGIAELITGDTEKIITDTLQKISETGPKIIESFTEKINEKMPDFINSVGNIVTQFVETINANLPSIIDSAIELITTFVKSIADQIPKLLPELVETLIIAFMKITDQKNLDRVSEAGAKLILKLIEGMLNSIPKLIENTDFTFKTFVNILSGGQVLVRKIGFALIKALIKGIIEAIPDLLSSAVRIVKEIIDKISSKAGQLVSKGKDVLKWIKDGIVAGIAGMASVGKNIVQGLWNGITGSKDWIVGKVRSFAKGILDSMKSALGIHSPSTLFRDEVGKMIAKGIGVGFEDELDNVYDDMQKAVDIETGKMSANVQTSGTYQMAMAGLPTFNLKDNSQNTTQLVVNGKVLAETVNTENRNREVARA